MGIDIPQPDDEPSPKSHREARSLIEMPEDRRERMTAKLEEYRRRLNTLQSEHPFSPPEHEIFAGTVYKIALAEKLLKDGFVDTLALGRELQKKYDVFFGPRYQNACNVIDDYCRTGGQSIYHPKGSNPF